MIKKYFNNDVTVVPTSSVVDSLSTIISEQDDNILEYRKAVQKLEEEKLHAASNYNTLKRKYYEEKSKELEYIMLPLSDSAKHDIITGYFIEQNIPLYYSRW